MLLVCIILGIIFSIIPLPHKSPQKTTAYHKYLRSYKWRKKRLQRLEIDSYQCQHCGAKASLEVHHITYKRIYRELMKDLLTLCKSCHVKEHHKINLK